MKKILCTLLAIFSTASAFAEVVPWVVYYAESASPLEFEPFQLIVLEPSAYPSIRYLKKQGKTVLGYLNIGEVEDTRPYYEALKKEGILLMENANWPGSYFIDIRDPRWTTRIIEELIPGVLRRRYNGIFLDTLDNAEALELTDPVKYKGMKEAAVNLIQAIRLHYPDMPIMVNRAYYLFANLTKEINMLLSEDVMTTYNFKEKKYELLPKKEVAEHLQLLEALRKSHPGLQIFALDYWEPKDSATIRTIYNTISQHDISPYVSTIQLDEVVPRPHE